MQERAASLQTLKPSRILTRIFTATAATATVFASGIFQDLTILSAIATKTAITGKLLTVSSISLNMSLPTTRAIQATFLTSFRMFRIPLRAHTRQAMTGAIILKDRQTRLQSPRAEATMRRIHIGLNSRITLSRAM